MSFTDIPEMTDPEKILAALDELNSKLDRMISGMNSIGENMNWLTENTKGIFQVFANPMMINQVMGMMGGIPNGGDDSIAGD